MLLLAFSVTHTPYNPIRLHARRHTSMDHTVRSLAYLDVISDDKNILSDDFDSDNEALAMSVLLLKATYTILELMLYSSRTLDLAMKL